MGRNIPMAEVQQKKSRASFSGKIGYILSAAGSAVGLGNIWRFPYLAAKYGGGIFLLCYILLALTFGYTMMISETTLGRMTRKSPVGAFSHFSKKPLSKFGGWINAIIPMIIVPYYCVIGGWVLRYLFAYIVSGTKEVAKDTFFNDFLGNASSQELWFIIFAAATFLVIIAGVNSGVERISTIMMPTLVVLAIVIAIYSVTRPGALGGVKYLFVPDFKNFSIITVVAAMEQMFYSLSIAMGILYTYGSYMKKDVNIETSTWQVQIFDTGIAILAAMMIIPSVFAFQGGDVATLKAGPSLLFISLPNVFASMTGGRIVGAAFFLLVALAALTSSISLLETSVSTFEDELHGGRKKAVILMFIITMVLGTLSALGYSLLGGVKLLGMQFLDFFDFLSNSIMMPLAGFSTCMLVIAVVKIRRIEKEVKISSKFRFEGVYRICVKFLAPVLLIVILVASILSILGIITV